MAFSGGTADIHGDVSLTAGARVVTGGAGTVTTFFDDVTHNGLEIFTGEGASTVFFGARSGAGNLTGTGTVYELGDLRPGNSPGQVSYGSDVVFGASTVLTMELAGLTAGVAYDQLAVAGALTLDGTLQVVLFNGWQPSLGEVYDLFDSATTTGAFDAVNLPALGGTLAWDASQLSTSGQLSVVPEPGALPLALLGAGLLARRRRSQSTAAV